MPKFEPLLPKESRKMTYISKQNHDVLRRIAFDKEIPLARLINKILSDWVAVYKSE